MEINKSILKDTWRDLPSWLDSYPEEVNLEDLYRELMDRRDFDLLILVVSLYPETAILIKKIRTEIKNNSWIMQKIFDASIKRCNISGVKYCKESGVIPKNKDLLNAIEYGCFRIVCYLIDEGMPITKEAFEKAVKIGDILMVRKLYSSELEKNTNLITEQEIFTPLGWR